MSKDEKRVKLNQLIEAYANSVSTFEQTSNEMGLAFAKQEMTAMAEAHTELQEFIALNVDFYLERN